jgi:glycosyltransferase involved in cell wall biosynthesis
MKKKKLLIHSNHCKAFTGFGKHTKNILIHLHKTGKYDIVEFSNGMHWGDPELKKLPWKCEGSLPNDPGLLRKLNQDPNLGRQAGYGAQMIDQIIKEEKPDMYIGIEDIWGFSGYTDKKWWNKINSMIWTTLDSLPILPEAEKVASKIKHYYVWSSFAERALKELGHDHVKTLHGAVDTGVYHRLKDESRKKLREKYSIPEDEFIIGFVFRNQLRKSVPNLLEGFKLFLQQNPGSRAKLFLHTHWQEGWDIPRLIQEKGLDPSSILTTYVCQNCKEYEIKSFAGEVKESGENQDCRFCGAKGSQVTTNVKVGVSEDELNQIYNLMDVYCHPFTSGGQEIPVQEAKLTELITIVTNYSCGEEGCSNESGGLPLDWSEYREPGTQFIKASTSPSSIAKQLKKVYNMKPSKRTELGRKARQYVIDNYSIEAVCTKLEKLIDSLPEIDWDFDFTGKLKNPEYNPPKIENDAEWLIDLYKNILDMEVDKSEDGHKHWMNRLSQDSNRGDVLAYFKQVALEDNQKNRSIDFNDILGKDDKGRRLLISMPQSIGDVYLCTALLKNIKETYPEYNIYFATKPEYFHILEGNPYIFKTIPYSSHLDNLPTMEGQGEHEGYFEIAFLPFIGTQRILNYMHNGKDKLQFDLCT